MLFASTYNVCIYSWAALSLHKCTMNVMYNTVYDVKKKSYDANNTHHWLCFDKFDERLKDI